MAIEEQKGASCRNDGFYGIDKALGESFNA